ncbi:MAG: Oxaloacetate decarboxylase [Rhodospirillales bacterium]|nr:Oxaloacetate decarboxylase [Rhodospirillales bacterium]
MTVDDRRERFRAILAGDRCVVPGSVFDPISARIAADVGFEAGILGGSVASLAVLGAPDLTVITLTELAEQVRRICRAATLPLIVDADHGYGNALNVMRTVEEFETAGVAALTIEDTLLPEAFGGGKPRLIPLEEGVGKLRAALAARRDPALVIVGRTSAPAITGVDDAIARLTAYQRVGVDALFIAGVKTLAELDAIAAAVDLPLVIGGLSPDLADDGALAARKVRIAVRGHLPILAAVQAIYATQRALRDGGKPDGLASGELMKQVTRDADYKRWMREFMGGA